MKPPRPSLPLVAALCLILAFATGAAAVEAAFAVNAKAHGAKGDGVTDDSDAIQAAVAKATEERVGIVFFPPGEYLLSRGVYLDSNLTLSGAPGAVLRKVPAVTQRFSQPVPKGGKTVAVPDASAYRVGQDCYLWDGEGSTYTGTVGRIKAVDPAANIVTFEGLKSDGAKKDYKATQKSLFSTSFSMLTTSTQGKAVENLTIEGLTFDCQRQPDEPLSYPLAPIHIDPRPAGTRQRHITIRGNTVLNSASDGISVQGCENATIEDNRVYNCAGNGIHVGFTIPRVIVRNNHIEGCGDSAIYWCYAVTDMIVTHNFIKDCNIGCGGIDLDGHNSVIAFNSFDGNRTAINMSGNLNGRTVINGNLFANGKGTDISLYVSSFCVISNNMFSDGKQVGISLRGVDRATVTDNQFFDYKGEYAIRLWRQPGGPQRPSQRVRIAGNIIVGGTRACILAEDSKEITLSENQCSPAEGGKAIEIAASCSAILLRDNLAEGEVVNQAASQP